MPKLHKTKYPVHFYKINSAVHYISIDKYCKDKPPTIILPDIGQRKVPKEVQQKAVLDQDVTGQFSFTNIYFLGTTFSEFALRQLLCAYLQPGEKAELYKCQALTESIERDRAQDQIIELQEFVDNGVISTPLPEYYQSSGKLFRSYVASMITGNYCGYIRREDAIRIYADVQEEFIPYEIAKKALGKYKY